MYIPDHLINSLLESTRPVVIYRHEDGSFRCGFVLREDEFVTSFKLLLQTLSMAGMETELQKEEVVRVVKHTR
ncbi:hypothetical protein OUHCRE11_32360 [Enterobacter asburiae]|nr:hypothetical protein ENTKAS01_15230 [Enterobacter sp. AS-1]